MNINKSLTLTVILLFISVSVIPSTGTIVEKKSIKLIFNGNILYVGGSGGGNYSKIQDAINDASDGDTVFVYDESSPYYGHVTVNKAIDLIGEDKNTTIIDAFSITTVLVIDSPRVNITGFTIRNGGSYHDLPAGICVKTNDNRIYGNIISKNERIGIYILSSDNIVFDNIISGSDWGISIEGRRNEIINNHITNNDYKGIYLLSGNNLISGNSIIYNGEGDLWDSGLQIWHDDNEYNEIINNVISNNNPTGIIVMGDNNYISQNQISNNSEIGVSVEGIPFLGGGYGNQIIENNISNNNLYGIFSYYTGFTEIKRNNLIGNGKNSFFKIPLIVSFTNKWDENYWSDYNGIMPFKIIPGRILYYWKYEFPWFKFDWNPAQEPYDI